MLDGREQHCGTTFRRRFCSVHGWSVFARSRRWDFSHPKSPSRNPMGSTSQKATISGTTNPNSTARGDFYQELIPTEPVDYKYYAVSDGSRTHVAGRRVTSKLYGEKQFLGQIQIEPALAASLRKLVDQCDLRGVGVDLVKDDDGQYWAVDVNLAAGYRDTGLEPALTESIIASLTSE